MTTEALVLAEDLPYLMPSIDQGVFILEPHGPSRHLNGFRYRMWQLLDEEGEGDWTYSFALSNYLVLGRSR